MSIVLNRQGMTQTHRLLPALDPSYYSIEERELLDHIRYLQRYAKKLRFHQKKDIETETKENEKQFWSEFLNFTEQELTEIVSILKQPTLLEQNTQLQSKYFQPHYSLVFTFIKLLEYPKLRMSKLTRDHLDYCYRLSLQISQKAARSDQVHVIVELASYIEQLALDKGTLVSAGEDSDGRRIAFEVSQDLLFNHAQVSDICSVQFDHTQTGLAEIRRQGGEGLAGFNAMLLHALGLEALPAFPKLIGLEQALSLSQLLNNWYPNIRDLSAEQLSRSDREYVFNRLNFLSLSECQFIFDVLYRESRQGAEGVLPVTEREWQQVYRIITSIHAETHRKNRIAQLKQWHQEKGVNGLLAWLFGEPGPGDMLYAFPKLNLAGLTQVQQQVMASYPVAALYFSQTSAAIRYVQKHLCMERSDFSQLMSNILGETSVTSWDLVYRLLENAWTKKRHYTYPSVADTRVTGMRQQVLHHGLDNIKPFNPFQGTEAAEQGLHIQSDLLVMNEGNRKVELIIDCNPETLPLNTLAELRNDFPASEFFKVLLSTEQGWQGVPDHQFDFGAMLTEPVIRDTASHTVQISATSYTLSNQSDALKGQLPGQYIALENGCCFEIEQLIHDGKELLLRPVLYKSGLNSASLIAKFNLTDESGQVEGDLTYSSASQVLRAVQESFSPEQLGHFVVDDNEHVYQILRFINASEVVASILCRVSNASELTNKVWKSLQPELVPTVDLSDLQLTHATLHDLDIDIRARGNSIDFICPEACTAQQLFTHWQEASINNTISTSHFELQMTGSGNTLLPEGEQSLPTEDRWLKRYRSVSENGLDVTFEGRRDEAASFAILAVIEEPMTRFLLKGNELNIIPAMNATANEVASAWRHWRSVNVGSNFNAASNFNVVSQDKRLLALQPLSEQFMLPLDIQEKAYDWLDPKQNGLRFSYSGASAQSASVLLKENIIDDYDFEIAADNVLTVLYPLRSKTLGSSLIKAWTQWHSDILNDANGFAIKPVGDDILDISARAEFELGAVYQVLLGDETHGIAIKHFGDLADDTTLTILAADVFKAEFERTPTSILIRVPENSAITAQELLLHWQDWQVANPASGLNLDVIVYGENVFTVVPQTQHWTRFGANGDVGEHGLTIDYTRTQHPDQKPNARVVCWENTGATDAFEFSFENDELTDSAVLHIRYPQKHSERTIEQLVQSWDDFFVDEGSSKGFSIAAAGEGSWQVSGDKICALTPTQRAHYRISTSGSAYIHFDFDTYTAGVPHLTMVEHTESQFNIQFELPEVEQTGGVPNVTIYYPGQSEYQTADNLYHAWYQLSQHHGFVLRDNSSNLEARTVTSLAETGNQIKYLDYHDIRLRYAGSEQDVTLKVMQQSPFDSSTEGQQLLLDSGLLFEIGKKLNRNTANIALNGAVEFQQLAGIYPADSVKRHSMRITTEVDASFMPIVPIRDSESAGTEKAAIKMLLNPDYGMDEPYFLYPVFRDIVIEQAKINVDVRNLTSVISRSQDGSLDTQSQIAPFGRELGFNATFDFAHPELCGKPLQALYCEYDWHELIDPITQKASQPPDIQAYYKSYGLLGDHTIADVANEDFTTSLAIFNRNQWHALAPAENLFVAKQHYPALNDTNSDPGLLISPEDVANWQTYFRLQLNGDFYHRSYRQLQQKLRQIQLEASTAQAAFSSAVQAKRAYYEQVKATRIALEQARQNGEAYQPAPIAAVPELPNPRKDAQEFSLFELPLPFSPLLNKLQLGYRASGQIDLSGIQPATGSLMPIELFRQQPFGIRKMAGQDSDHAMLPVYKHQGYLYLGLTNLSGGQSVSLLFQIAPGTGDVSHERTSASWSYLAGENWQTLPQAALLKDETYHLQNTGLLQLTLPIDASTEHTLMPANRIWLRMAFERDIERLPTILGVHAQAVLAEYALNEQAVERLQAPLAANTITALVDPLPGLQALKQPYVSFAGRGVETEQDYYQRAAERLKHKQRCLTLTDYETLALSEFSELHQVLCMPNALYREQREGAGALLAQDTKDLKLIVIAKSAPTLAGLAMRPSASQLLINRVQAFVDKHKPVRTQVEVINPGFETLTFRLAVKFKPGFDKGFYVKTLNQAIVDYLSPWSDQAQSSLNFGRTLYSAAVVNVIESQAYVDYVANFSLLRQVIAHQGYQEVVPLFLSDDHAASSLYPGNLLVSGDQHIIDVIESELYDASAYQGIGYMQIGADYWVDRPGDAFMPGIGQLLIQTPRIYPELLKKELQQEIPELTDISMLWQALLESEYVTEQYELGPRFNTDLGLDGFEVELSADAKLTLYKLFIARRQWQPSEYRWQLG